MAEIGGIKDNSQNFKGLICLEKLKDYLRLR
jgi:hypothetical protein